jgi:hypothetical protein
MSGSFLQGGALPDVKETTTSTTTPTSTEYSKLLSDISSAGSGALTKAGVGADGKPITVAKTGADLVAGYDPMQTLGYNALPGAVNAYKPGLDAAQQTASRAAAGITPGRIQSLMNPYTTNVVNEMARLSQQNVERNLMPTMTAGFVGTGGLGSQRYANALGQSMADTQANLTGQQYGALSKGYSEALKGALDEAQLMNLSAKTQGDLAKMQQQLGIEGAGALTKAGAERQGYEQAILDAPLKNAKNAADLLRTQSRDTEAAELLQQGLQRGHQLTALALDAGHFIGVDRAVGHPLGHNHDGSAQAGQCVSRFVEVRVIQPHDGRPLRCRRPRALWNLQ